MMEGNEFSEYMTEGPEAADFADGYTAIGRHGHSVLGRLIRHGRVWFVKSYDFGGDVTEADMRLRKEYELLLRLNHQGIVRVGWIERIPDAGLCLTMEFVDGETLDGFLEHASRAERRAVSDSLLKAMAYVHSEGVCHLDLKPQNIMVVGRGESLGVKIIDFGMSAWGGNVLFRHGGGTRSFGAPEQFEADYRPTPRSDVYSLGQLLRVIDGGYEFKKASRVAIRREPDDRPADAGALLALVRRSRRRRVYPAIASVVAIAAVSGGLWYGLNSEEPATVGTTVDEGPVTSGVEEVSVAIADSGMRADTVVRSAPQIDKEQPKGETETKDEYDLLVDQWLMEMEWRADRMTAVATREDLSVDERKKLIEQMNDTLIEDTYNFFQPYREKQSSGRKNVLPISCGSIYEPRFQAVRRQMADIYHSIKE